MARNTSCTLTQEQDEYLQAKAAAGTPASEVIRTALDRLIDEERKEAWLIQALKEGEESGPGLTVEQVRMELRDRHPWLNR